MFWVDILRNPTGDFYTGHTNDLVKRFANHNRTDKISGKFTRKDGPWILVWFEQHPDRSSAMRREREIKSWKSSKHIQAQLLGSPRHFSGRARPKSGLTD
jgi:predicted GIY-YIG superfamily endonuclease